MVRPATSPTTGPVDQARADDDVEGAPAPVVEETTGGVRTSSPDLETAQTAEAKVRSDPVAQQHQLRISAKLDKRVDPEKAAQLVRVGHKISHAIYDRGSRLSKDAAEALQGASQLTGGRSVVTHGTITKEGTRFVYSAEPKDALVVPDGKGGTRTFKFDKIEGNLSSFDAFFGGDHNFSFNVKEGDGTDLDVVTKKTGRDHHVTVKGKIPYDGTTYDADIRYHGNERRENDSTGGSYVSTAKYSGTVKGDGITLTVEETQRYESVSAVRTDRIGGSATTQSREINNRLEVGNETFQWKGCRTHQAFRNGVASNRNRGWSASGELYRNGELLGTYQLGVGRDALSFELDIGGKRHEIDSYRTR